MICSKGSQTIRRHILTSRISITFDARRAIITVTAPVDGTKLQLEIDMLDPKDRPDPDIIKALEAQAAETGEELWDRVRVPNILKAWIHSIASSGQYEHGLTFPDKIADIPSVYYAPAIILRKQSERSLIHLYEDISTHLTNQTSIPVGVERLTRVCPAFLLVGLLTRTCKS